MSADLRLRVVTATCATCAHFNTEKRNPETSDAKTRLQTRAWVNEQRKAATRNRKRLGLDREYDPIVDLPDPWQAVDHVLSSMRQCEALTAIYGESTFQRPAATCPNEVGPKGEILSQLYSRRTSTTTTDPLEGEGA